MTDEMKCGPMSDADWKDQRIASLEAYIAQIKAALPSSPAPATTGDIPTGSRPPAPAAMGHSSGAGEAISPADLAEVLENVRKAIAWLDRTRQVPIELHKACQALTHMTKGEK